MVNYEGNSLNYKLSTNIFGYWWHIHCIDILIITKTKLVSFWHFRHWLHRKLSYWQLPVQPVTKMSTSPFRFSDADRTRNGCFIQGCHNQHIQWYFFVKKAMAIIHITTALRLVRSLLKQSEDFLLNCIYSSRISPEHPRPFEHSFYIIMFFNRNTCLYNILGHFIHVFLLNMMITGWQWLSTAALRPGSEQRYVCHQGFCFIWRCSIASERIPIIKTRRPHDRLICIMGVLMSGKTLFVLKRGRRWGLLKLRSLISL